MEKMPRAKTYSLPKIAVGKPAKTAVPKVPYKPPKPARLPKGKSVFGSGKKK